MLCFLRQVRVLDGVAFQKHDHAAATLSYTSHVKAFNDSLQDVEDAYRRDLLAIDAQQANKDR